jgi:hypothetical protein
MDSLETTLELLQKNVADFSRDATTMSKDEINKKLIDIGCIAGYADDQIVNLPPTEFTKAKSKIDNADLQANQIVEILNCRDIISQNLRKEVREGVGRLKRFKI